jgi:hypothetical protein
MKDFKTVKAKNEATYLKAKEQNIRLFWKTYAEFVRINTFKRNCIKTLTSVGVFPILTQSSKLFH